MIKRIQMDRLITFGVDFMTKRGVHKDHAEYVAQVVVETEAFKQSTHGLAQYGFINGALGKSIDPAAEPKIVSRHGASAAVDGAHSLGHLAVKLAKELAIEAARTHGIGFVAVRDTEWIGALGIYLISIADEGLLCQAWAQSNTCKDSAPYGGIDARFSTNPIALAFPTDGNPVVADFSTSTMSLSGASSLSKEGKKTEVPRFLDNAGNPVSDPSVMDREGTLMFMGGDAEGHKGYGLSLFNEALTVLAGGSANNPEAVPSQSFLLMVLDPAAFGGSEYYIKEMRRFLAHVKSSRVRSSFQEIRLPGERAEDAFKDKGSFRVEVVPVEEPVALQSGMGIDDMNPVALTIELRPDVAGHG